MVEKNELAVVLKNQLPTIKKLAGRYVNPDRMMAVMLEAVKNPKLAACKQESVIASFVKMADLGTDRVGPGGVWLVPFGNEMTVIPDWRLMVAKAVNAGVIKYAKATVVHSGDLFDYEYGLDPKLTHKPKHPADETADMTDVYCAYTLPDGTRDFVVMPKAAVEKIRKRSKAANAGPWVTDYEAMAQKTVVRQALKPFEGRSPELQKVIDADNVAVGFGEITDEPIAEPRAIDAPATTLPAEEKAEVKVETPPAGDLSQGGPLPPAEELVETHPKTPQDKCGLILQYAAEIAGQDKAPDKILEWSTFTGKDGTTVAGKENPFDLSPGRITVVYGKAKTEYYAWKKGEGK